MNPKKINLCEKNHFLGPRRPFFVTLFVSFAKNKASSYSNPVIRTLKGFCQKYGLIIIIGKVHAFKARSSHSVITTLEGACKIYGSIHIFGKQPWVNFFGLLGGG